MITEQSAGHLIGTAVETIAASPEAFREVLDAVPAAIYVADREGTITYFNKACVELAGRTPQVGVDKWCVSWKVYTPEGEYLPHDRCPMAVTIRDKEPIRDVEAVAERPDGTRVHFIPYPTPLFDNEGNLVGAVNLLLDVTEQRKPEYLRAQAARCRRLAAGTSDATLAQTLTRMSARYDDQAIKLSH